MSLTFLLQARLMFRAMRFRFRALIQFPAARLH